MKHSSSEVIMSFNRKFALAFTASILLAAGTPAVWAQEVTQPATASTVDLGGGTSALAYWVDDANGRNVITTVDTVVRDQTGQGEDRHAVVRFSAHLLPGQAQTVSVPSFGAEQPQELQIRRSAQGIEIDRVSANAIVD
jgi:hypothetical protein